MKNRKAPDEWPEELNALSKNKISIRNFIKTNLHLPQNKNWIS